MTSPWRRRRERTTREAEAAHAWQRRMYELTRPTHGHLNLGVLTPERGWEIPPASLEILEQAGTFDAARSPR